MDDGTHGHHAPQHAVQQHQHPAQMQQQQQQQQHQQHQQPQRPPLPPFDQMQLMLTKVLECTGHVFRAAAQGANPNKAAATALRLKQIVPEANNRFHDALDELESEVMMARHILRRELDALRDRETTTANGHGDTREPRSQDVDMTDAIDHTSEPLPTIEAQQPPAVAQMTDGAAESKASTLENPTVKDPAVGTSPVKVSPNLQIDTSRPAPAAEEADLNTGRGSVMDFADLFNDPASATGSVSNPESPPKPTSTPSVPKQPPAAPATQATAPNSTTVDKASNDDQDLSSLLPGLESYANAANDTVDLMTPKPEEKKQDPFSTINPSHPQTQKQTPQQEQQQQHQLANSSQPQAGEKNPTSNDTAETQPVEQRDTTFDDLMNFADFDMGDFGGEDGDFAGGGTGTTFDDSFFDV